jgi:hypothetical protein
MGCYQNINQGDTPTALIEIEPTRLNGVLPINLNTGNSTRFSCWGQPESHNRRTADSRR